MFAAAMRLAIVRAGGGGSAAALFPLDQQGCVAATAQQRDQRGEHIRLLHCSPREYGRLVGAYTAAPSDGLGEAKPIVAPESSSRANVVSVRHI
jgi:hypothetical protein